MRISQIVKKSSSSAQRRSSGVKPKKKVKEEEELPLVPEESKGVSEDFSHDVQEPVNADDIRREVREDLEQEFEKKMQQIEKRMQSFYEKRLDAKEEELKEIQKKLTEKTAHEPLLKAPPSQEPKVEPSPVTSPQAKQDHPTGNDDEIKSLKKQLEEKEAELRMKEATLKNRENFGDSTLKSRASSHSSPKPPSDNLSTPKDSEPYVEPLEALAARQAKENPKPAINDISKEERHQSRLELLKKHQVEVTAMHNAYEEIVRAGGGVTEEIIGKKKPDMKGFENRVKLLIDLAQEHDGELIGIAQQPYPSENHFHYHSANCMILSIAVGIDLGLESQTLMDLALGAFFHDIALFTIKGDLDYPKELSAHLKKEVKEHATEGAKIMQDYLNEDAINAIAHHHETCNGRGYPRGIELKEISLLGRIVGVVDAFEAMTHSRPYRKKAIPVSEAIKEIVSSGGRGAYDKRIVKALMARIGLYPVTSLVELSNKQIARVIRQNKKFPLSPVVKVEFDEWGHKLRKNMIVDLSESRLIHVVGTLEEVESYQTKKMAEESTVKSDLLEFLSKVLPIVLMIGLLGGVFYIILKV